MFIHLVILLFLSCAHVREIDAKEAEDRTSDQFPTASGTAIQNSKESEQKTDDFRDQLIPSMIDATAHYENVKKFAPIVVLPNLFPEASDTPSVSQTNTTEEYKISDLQNNPIILEDTKDTTKNVESESKENETSKITDDITQSTQAEILANLKKSGTNRRSFEFERNQNEFELLKVGNNTPAVANYQDFYENVENAVVNSKDDDHGSPAREENRDRGKRIEDYVNYGRNTVQGNNGDSSYDVYYSYNSVKDSKKASYESEKVAGNYHGQDAVEYDGHGQSSGRQNELTAPSLVRTNQEISELTRDASSNHNESFDNVAVPSSGNKSRHRFSRPVVVVDPSNYNVNFRYSDQPSSIFNSNMDDYQTSRVIDSTSSEMAGRYTSYNREGRYRTYSRDDDSRDASDDSRDYADYTERPKRVQKGRRRPHASESSRRLPKEHRTSVEDSLEYEDHNKRHHLSRSKSHRQKAKVHAWSTDNRNHGKDESSEETRYDGRSQGTNTKGTKLHQTPKFRPSNAWNQISPNLEISHSSGVELDHIEKPKFIVPFKVNLVPFANFDHATALGNSQGFDMSNAVLQNVVTATPVNTVTSANHLLNTPQNVIGQNVHLQNVAKNMQSIGVSPQVSDIIVGQNAFQTPLQSLLFPQASGQTKFSTNFKPQYMSSTVSPVYAVTPTLSPGLQSLSVQNGQTAVTPRPAYAISASPSPPVQQVSVNQIQPGSPQLIVPQPALHTLSSLLSPMQNIPLMTTVSPSVQALPIGKVNLLKADTQNKKSVVPGSTTSFLASTNLVVGQNEQKQSTSGNSYYLQNGNLQQIMKPQPQEGLYQYLKSIDVTPKPKTYIQTTHIMPAVMHPVPTLTTINGNPQQLITTNHNQQYLTLQSSAKLPSFTYQTVDNVGSHSSSNINTVNAVSGMTDNAHLPNVGTKNVEILNPNIKPSPIDTTVVNTYEAMQYPTAVLTTPIPMFSTTSFVTARPAVISTTTAEALNPQSYVDSLTELGAKSNQASLPDPKTMQNQERPMFNPINFVPNIDLVKSQNLLNSKLHSSQPLQQNLNLVPLIPGGNFFKPSFSAQSELVVKPKLTSDLEKYAEQMFKESLQTMYNSQKWNNDRKLSNRHNNSDASDLAKLKNELQRLKASLSQANSDKDLYEAHQSENKLKIAELLKHANLWDDKKKPDQLVVALEQVLKTRSKDRPHRPRGHSKPSHSHKLHDHGFDLDDDFQHSKYVKDFLTPPKYHSHRSKNPFQDKPSKKRPGTRFAQHSHHHGPRSHSLPRQSSPKSAGLETAASTIDLGFHADSPFDNIPHRHFRDDDAHELKKGSFHLDSYPTFTTTKPESIDLAKLAKNRRPQRGKDIDINHPRTHNLFGLLMKNNRLPAGMNANYFRDKDQLREFFEDEKRRQQQQFYDDALREYILKSAGNKVYADLNSNDGRRAFTKKSVA